MQVITCFSYKGGSGRTVAAANIAAALASSASGAAIETPLDFKVALLDLDVFSAGTHRVFGIPSNYLEKSESPCLQDYLMQQIEPGEHIEKGAIRLEHDLMKNFSQFQGADKLCRRDFSLYPSRPSPDERFIVAKYHHNLLLSLIYALEKEDVDYVVIDGEAGTRSMAEIAIRLADVVLMMFRLTWQHVDGTLNAAREFLDNTDHEAALYLLPTCVPLLAERNRTYLKDAPGWRSLERQTQKILRESDLSEFALTATQRNLESVEGKRSHPGPGHFWKKNIFIHDSLILKGEEGVLVFNPLVEESEIARDYYRLAVEVSELHPPV